MLVVAVIEEAAKIVVPAAMLALPRYRRGPANGLVLGVASGAGFAALETMGYAVTVLTPAQPGRAQAWTGLTAAALWYAARGRSVRGLGWFVLTYLVAVGLHTVWDSVGGVLVYAVLALVAFTLLLLTTRQITRTPLPT